MTAQLVAWLVDQEQSAQLHYGDSQRKLRELVAMNFAPVGERELRAFFKECPISGDLSERRKFIFMEQFVDNGDWLPVFTLRYDFTKNDLNIRLGLFRLEGEGEQLQSLGFRFETPQRTAEDRTVGRHQFHHAQLTKNLAPDWPAPDLPTPKWLPEVSPSFPLSATSYVQLMVAMIVSIYGLLMVGRIPTDIRRTLATEIREMRILPA